MTSAGLGAADAAKNYRPDIDGLRAIAVLSVLMFHFNFPQTPGGFVGVDVFFVISGYLITRIIFGEIEEERFTLSGFYARRIRRILPALLVMVLATLVAAYWLISPGSYVSLAESAVAAVASFANLYFLTHTDYFDAASHSMPLLHTWSLSVEEQFYLAWPLILLLPFWRGDRKATFFIVALITVVGFIVCVAVTFDDQKLAFYLPFTRAWELSLGGALVFLPPITNRLHAECARFLGLALIIGAVVLFPSDTPFPGWRAAIPVIGSALIITPSTVQTFGSRLLSTAPFVFVGKISYSLYLWHWPVSVYWLTYTQEVFSGTDLLIAVSLSFVLAWLSWRFVERPFRRPTKLVSRTLIRGAVAVITISGVAVFVGLADGFPSRISKGHHDLLSLKMTWNWDCAGTAPLNIPTQNCVAGKPWEEAKTRGVIWGDSHAEHFMPLVHKAAIDADASVALLRTCIAILRPAGAKIINFPSECSLRTQFTKLIRDTPDIRFVILAGEWTVWLHQLYRKDGDARSPSIGLEILRTEMASFVDELLALNVKVLLFTEVPTFSHDPIPCILFTRRCSSAMVNFSRDRFDRVQKPATEALREIAIKRKDVLAVVPTDGMCGEKTCRTFVDNEFIYRDIDHLRRNLSPRAIEILSDEMGITAAMNSVISD